MKIAIDARFYGAGHTGLGRYTTNVLKFLPKYLKNHTLQVLLRDEVYSSFPAGPNIQKVRAEVPHYSLAEQLLIPPLLKSLGSNLLYTFHFNTPVFSKVPQVVTVHDVIKSHFIGRDTTTRAPWLYTLKRFGYNQVIRRTLTRAQEIVVPTNTVKNDILALYSEVKPERIHPVKEAPDAIFRQKVKRARLDLPSKYLLFVGNAYPHKNLKVLLQAYKLLGKTPLSLVIIAKETPFLTKALQNSDQTQIKVISNVADEELVAIYRQASILVTPSLMEGYGLVGLEALMVGTPVIASNIACYREVYGKHVTYFNPHDPQELKEKITSVLRQKRPAPLSFDRTWNEVAKEVAEVIHACCARL